MHRMIPYTLMMAIILSSACSSKTSQQVVADLWSGWEQSEDLLQVGFPDAIPLILVHGWNGGEHTWPSAEQLMLLEKRWQRDIYLFTYRTGIFANRYPPLEILEEQLDQYIAVYPKIDVVAHSMGGLLVRHYLGHHLDSSIRRVVFLATPHFGTDASQLLLGIGSIAPQGNIQATEMQPGSDFLWQLNSLEGSELDEVEALNVFIDNKSLLRTDFVVEPASAYLPGAHNVAVAGRHHGIAKSLLAAPFVERFLQHGELPAAAEVPARRDVWIRMSAENGVDIKPRTGQYKVYNGRGLPVQTGISLCCKGQSGLYADGAVTVLIEDVQADYRYEFPGLSAHKTLALEPAVLLRSKNPISLMSMKIPAVLQDNKATLKPESQSVGTP